MVFLELLSEGLRRSWRLSTRMSSRRFLWACEKRSSARFSCRSLPTWAVVDLDDAYPHVEDFYGLTMNPEHLMNGGLDTLVDGYARIIMYLDNGYVFRSRPQGPRSLCIQLDSPVSVGPVLTGGMERWSLRSETTSTQGIDGGFFLLPGVENRGFSCPRNRSRRCIQGLMWMRNFPQSWSDS